MPKRKAFIRGNIMGSKMLDASQLMAEARKMSEAGNEQECMKKLAELKDILRVK
jgi:hypothetical protein